MGGFRVSGLEQEREEVEEQGKGEMGIYCGPV